MKSKFEIENPTEFLSKLDKKIPSNPDPNNLRKPGMNSAELRDFMTYLNKETVMLEVGGGASSVYWTRYVKELVVIEPSQTVADRISESISNLTKGSDFVIHCIRPNFQQKKLSIAAKPGQFDDMIQFISKLENEKFDVAFVDGRDRVRSLEAAIHSVKLGGILAIHDFWFRQRYHSLLENKSLVSINPIEKYTQKNNSLGIFKRVV